MFFLPGSLPDAVRSSPPQVVVSSVFIGLSTGAACTRRPSHTAKALHAGRNRASLGNTRVLGGRFALIHKPRLSRSVSDVENRSSMNMYVPGKWAARLADDVCSACMVSSVSPRCRLLDCAIVECLWHFADPESFECSAHGQRERVHMPSRFGVSSVRLVAMGVACAEAAALLCVRRRSGHRGPRGGALEIAGSARVEFPPFFARNGHMLVSQTCDGAMVCTCVCACVLQCVRGSA